MSDSAAPRIRLKPDALRIHAPAVFGADAGAQARRFAGRVFALPEVDSVHLRPASAEAVVRFQVGPEQRADFLERFSALLAAPDEAADRAALPEWQQDQPASLFRFESLVSLFEVTRLEPGQLQLRHSAISRDPALPGRLELALTPLQGVSQASANGATGKLAVTFQPDSSDLTQLIRTAESQLAAPQTALVRLNPTPTQLGLANATLGLAAVGELALPAVLPVCVGMLVASNLGTIREAGRQISSGKLGLPVLYTALLGCSITTGQIVAHALMEWSFRFWAGRTEKTMAEQCRSLINDALPVPDHAHVVRSDQVDARLPSDLLRPGHHIRVAGGESAPADGEIVAGVVLVDEAAVAGAPGAVRKRRGDTLLAGSRILAGRAEVAVSATAMNTRAADLAQQIIVAARTLTTDPDLRGRARQLSDRAVPPTLAAAGVGWAVGGLFTVGAVLHQDYASGANLAVPVQTLKDMGQALRSGCVVRSGSALSRLGESRFLVLDAAATLEEPIIELASLESRLAEGETNNLLRYVAGAAYYLGDSRSSALAEVCRSLGLVVRVPQLIALEEGRVAVRQGQHTIALNSDESHQDNQSPLPLHVEIDGNEVARLAFRTSQLARAAEPIRQLRAKGMQVFLLSSGSEAETAALAQRLGIELHGGDFNPEQKIRFLLGLRKRGVKASYVAPRMDPDLARAAHVSVALGGANGASTGADLALLGHSLHALADVADLAMGHESRVRELSRRSLLPNLLCVAGGYAGMLNGITAGVLANIGVFNVYRQAADSGAAATAHVVLRS